MEPAFIPGQGSDDFYALMMGTPVSGDGGTIGAPQGISGGTIGAANIEDAFRALQEQGGVATAMGDVGDSAFREGHDLEMTHQDAAVDLAQVDMSTQATQVHGEDQRVSATGSYSMMVPGYGIYVVDSTTEAGAAIMRLAEQRQANGGDLSEKDYMERVTSTLTSAEKIHGITRITAEVQVDPEKMTTTQRDVMVTFPPSRWQDVGIVNPAVLLRLPASTEAIDAQMAESDFKIMFGAAMQGIPSFIMRTTNICGAFSGASYPTVTTMHYVAIMNGFYKTNMPSELVSNTQMHNLVCGNSPLIVMSALHSLESQRSDGLYDNEQIQAPHRTDINYIAQAERCYDLYWSMLEPYDACPRGSSGCNSTEVGIVAEAVRRLIFYGKDAFRVDCRTPIREEEVLMGDLPWPTSKQSFTHEQLKEEPDRHVLAAYVEMLAGRCRETAQATGMSEDDFVPVHARPRHVFVPAVDGGNVNYFIGTAAPPPDPGAYQMGEDPRVANENEKKLVLRHFISRTVETPQWFRQWFMGQLSLLSDFDPLLKEQISKHGGDLLPDVLPAFFCRRMMYLMCLFVAEVIFYFRRSINNKRFMKMTADIVERARMPGLNYTDEMAVKDVNTLHAAYIELVGGIVESWEQLVMTSVCDLVRPADALQQVDGMRMILREKVACGSDVTDEQVEKLEGGWTAVASRVASIQQAAIEAGWTTIDCTREDTKFVNASEMALRMERLWDQGRPNVGNVDPMGPVSLLLFMALDRSVFMELIGSLSQMPEGPVRNQFAEQLERNVTKAYVSYVQTIADGGGLLTLTNRRNTNRILDDKRKRAMRYDQMGDEGGEVKMVKRTRLQGKRTAQ